MHSAATPRFRPRLLQRAEQRDDDARAAGADRVAQRAGAAVHVDDLVRQLELAHRRHRHRGEGFVDLPQVDLRRRPSRPSSAPWRWRRPARWRTIPAPAHAPRGRRCAPPACSRSCAAVDSRISTSAAAPSEMLTGIGGGDRAVLLEGGLQRRDLVELGLEGLLVELDHGVAALAGQRDRRDLPGEAAVLVGRLGALRRWRWRTRPAPRA